MAGGTPSWSLYFLGSEEAAGLAGADSAGIVYQLPDGEAGWRTGARLRPGEASTRFAIRSATRPRRLVFLGQFGLEFAPWAVRAEAAGSELPLEVASARHSTLGDVTAAVEAAGGYDPGLFPGDTLALGYGAAAEASVGAKDWFLLVSKSASVAGTAGARRPPGGERSKLPAAFAPRQNRPNPFDQTTMIHFDLPVEASVRLEIFDAQGRLVRTLASGQFPAGFNALGWDRRDTDGRQLGAGVYLYRIQAGSFRDQKKMVLLEP